MEIYRSFGCVVRSAISTFCRLTAILPALLGAGLVFVQPCMGNSFVWDYTGNLSVARFYHSATLLPNGKVLVAGGNVNDGFGYGTSAELYDPSSGNWAATGSLANRRSAHTATLLPNGKVLVTGGQNAGGASYTASAELYDPSTGNWTTAGNLITARGYHTATLLSNGKVLVAGGFTNNGGTAASAELYDPAGGTNGTWTATGSLIGPRGYHTATLLPNGKVFVAGGYTGGSSGLPTAELFDPVSGSWTATSSLSTARFSHTATLLSSGKVLVAGGNTGSSALASAELFDPAGGTNGTWTATGSLNKTRFSHTATLLANGVVLVAGGEANGGAIRDTELYDPSSGTNGTWTATGSLNTTREAHGATLLPNGKVLVEGGLSGNAKVGSAELFDPAPPIIISPLSATATVGQQFTYQIIASGKPTSFTASNLPSGLILDAALGTISGTPSAAGTQNVTIGATNASGSYSKVLNLTINPAPVAGSPVITSVTAATGKTGASFMFQITASNITSAATVAANGLPAGLTLDPGTGLITGTVTTDGSYGVSLTLTDGSATATGSLQLTFTSDPAFPVITSPSSASLASGQPFTYTIVAPNNGSAGATTCSISGTLPPGLTFDASTCTISGTYNPPSAKAAVSQPKAFGSGTAPTQSNQLGGSASILGNVQLFAHNSAGTASAQLIFVAPSGLVGNVSTRLPVGIGENVLIEGFIVQGPSGSTKKIIVRAIGPSLIPFGITDALANPTLEIHDANNATIATNNDWKTTQLGGIITADQFGEINGSGVAPGKDLESAIVANLAPGSYTAVVGGLDGAVGTAVVDAYDISPASPARLANVATRGLIQPDPKLMIAGVIIQNGPVKAVIRAIGPSLTGFGIANALPDTTLQLRDQNGTIVRENDDWQTDQKQELESTGLQPTNALEAALVATIPPGQYTAQVRGKNQASGIGVVQVYFLQ